MDLQQSNIKEGLMTFMKGQVDKLLEKYLSRKLLVWITSTALLAAERISGDEWVAIALAYIGSQAVVDLAAKWKSASNKVIQKLED